MKLKKHNCLLLIITALAFTACKQKSGNTTLGISPEDSMKIAFYDKYFGDSTEASLIENNKDVPVDPDSAQFCIDNFIAIRKAMDPKITSKMLKTNYLSFNLKKFKKWLINNVQDSKYTDIRIYFGAYTKDVLANAHKPDSLENRLTVFLWPYNQNNPSISRNSSNQKIEPYNFGQLFP